MSIHDWRGEHLIRAPEKPKPRERAPVTPKPWGRNYVHAKWATCGATGCTTRLRSDNTSGVCKNHRHFPGACRCRDCVK